MWDCGNHLRGLELDVYNNRDRNSVEGDKEQQM